MRVEVVPGSIEAGVGDRPDTVVSGTHHATAGWVGCASEDIFGDLRAWEEPDADAGVVDEGGVDAAADGIECVAVGGRQWAVGDGAADVLGLVGTVDVAFACLEEAVLAV